MKMKLHSDILSLNSASVNATRVANWLCDNRYLYQGSDLCLTFPYLKIEEDREVVTE